MAIIKLPQATISLLGSAVDLSTPESLVKELVENSIDADATKIEVCVSANIIDKIQVRDDGHGIRSEDYDALGRRSHTSKLRTFEELQCKGGQTLGFRGNALASANIVSKLTIITRTTEDPVAKLLELNPNGGGIATRKSVSSLPGTTVDASNLFAALIVRKQQVVKQSKKIHDHLKILLQTYALTRPHIKLSLKVIKPTRRVWSYVPKEGADKTYSGKTSEGGSTLKRPNTSASVLRLEAFLPRIDANPAAIAGKGYFISVDSRPMNTDRGTMKKLIDIYRKYLHDCLRKEGLRTPFIRLNIKCILGSYDPNVATNKDEVLFANEPKLLTLFEDMCREIYLVSDHQSEPIEDCRPVEQLATGSDCPDLIPDERDEEMGFLVQKLFPEGSRDADELSAEEDSPIESPHLMSPPSDEAVDVGQPFKPIDGGLHSRQLRSKKLLDATDDAAEFPDDTIPLGSQRVLGGEVDRLHVHQSGLTTASNNEEPAQSLLRMGWEVDMARSETATPEGNTQEILLHPASSNIAELLSQLRREQAQRENPNPWSLAKTAASQKRGRRHDDDIQGLVKIGQVRDYSFGPSSNDSVPAFGVEEHPQLENHLADLVYSESTYAPRLEEPPQVGRCDLSFPVQRDAGCEMFESLMPQHVVAPHDALQKRRYLEVPGIPGNNEQLHDFGVRDEFGFDGLRSDIAQDLGTHQRGRAQTPHPFASFEQNYFCGMPPSSSPANKAFRVPDRVGPGKQDRVRAARAPLALVGPGAGGHKSDGLAQSKLTFNTTKNLQHPGFQNTEISCFPSMNAGYDDFDDYHIAMRNMRNQHRHVSPSATDKAVASALERLDALRHQPEEITRSDPQRPISPSMTEKAFNTAVARLNALRPQNGDINRSGVCLDHSGGITQAGGGELVEKRGRTIRRSTRTAPDMSPRAYLRKRLASRSRSRNKTHKRVRPEMLPFERPLTESNLQIQSLALDICQLEKQTAKAWDCDLYVSKGEIDAAFDLEPAEMDNISNKLQEIVEFWALEKHGVELELEINVGESLMGHMGIAG